MSNTDVDPLIRRPRRTVRSLVPILDWLPRYRTNQLAKDAVAGIAVAALLIPESMGYAGVAGVPAEFGLYAALAAAVAYAVFGGTSILVVGPASAVAALSLSLVVEFGSDVDALAVTAGLALVTGLLLVAAGSLRLGWIVNFISRPVLEAFVAGLSISIIIGQLDGLFRVDADGESATSKLVDVLRQIGDWHLLSSVLGVGAVVVLLLLQRFAERVPAAVVVVIAGIVLVGLFGLVDRGVDVVGEIPRGLPDVGVPDLGGVRWWELVGGGAALLLVGFSEGYAAASAVVESTGEEIDADQELIGSGAANIASGLVGGFAVSGSLSKSAAAEGAGARTQMTNLVAGVIVLATLLFLGPLFEDLPEPVLAAVVIVAVLRSADPREVWAIRRINRLDFAAAAVTFTLVLGWETLPAMIVGVMSSLAFLVRRASFPDVVELRRDDTGTWLRATPGQAPTDGLAVIRFEAPLVYANAARLRHVLHDLPANRPGLQRIVLDAEMVSDIDSTGAEALSRIDDELAELGIELVIARLHERGQAQLLRSHLGERFDGRLYPGVHHAAGA
jgi:SulP family sulfate permease